MAAHRYLQFVKKTKKGAKKRKTKTNSCQVGPSRFYVLKRETDHVVLNNVQNQS